MSSKKEMEQLREIAESYYHQVSIPEIKTAAQEFFKSMDSDGDDKVDLKEFLRFMKSHGYAHMRNSSFFDALDKSGRGALSFMDVMTIYYIVKSGRPFCASCKNFIPGIFFSCVQCFNADPKIAFDICHVCYKKKSKHSHSHGSGGALFLDNYILLHATRHSSTGTTTITTQPQTRVSPQSPREEFVVTPVSDSDDSAMKSFKDMQTQDFEKLFLKHRSSERSASRSRTQIPTSSTAIIPATRPPEGMRTEVATVFEAMEKLLAISDAVNNVVSAVSALSGCTIM